MLIRWWYASPRKLIGARDPFGFRPLCIGKRDNAYILASESCALDTIGAEFIRDVEPGEIVTITPDGIRSDKSMTGSKKAQDVFSNIFILQDQTAILMESVYIVRALRQEGFWHRTHPADADIVVGVPESGNAAAMGYSHEVGYPIRNSFCKEQLCRKNLYQTKAVSPRIKCYG